MEKNKFVLNVWAAVMRVLMAQYCVKYLTLKTRRNAVKYLPGKEKELMLIEKLGFSGDEIANRVWTYETKLALLADCNPALNSALTSDITTEKEFEAVWRRGTVKNVIAAMRVYTPSRIWLLKALNCGQFDIPTWCRIAKAVPAVFENLKPWEILGVDEKKPCHTEKDRWNLALTLAEAKSVWAPLFMTELRNIPPQQLEAKGEELMKKFFDIAFKAKSDISHLMPYLYVIFPELYLKVRADYASYKNFAPFVEKMFPQLFKFLEPDEEKQSFRLIKFSPVVEDKEEAYVWLFIVYNMLDNKDVYNCMLRCLQTLRYRVHKKMFNEMFEKMIQYSKTADQLKQLYAVCSAVQANPEQFMRLCDRIIQFSVVEEHSIHLGFAFPFKEWKPSLAKRAIVLMAERKQLALFINRLSELTPTLRNAAFEAMETQSQIDTLATDDVEKLVTTTQLLPKAEKVFLYLLTTRNLTAVSLHELKRKYIERVKLAGSSFKALLSDYAPLSMEIRAELVSIYAKKWKLSLEEYQLIMQSYMSVKAPFLRKYVKNQRDSVGR